jgi:hypothetical protein
VNGWLGVVGAIVAVVGTAITGYFTYRGSRAAAAIQAAPATKAQDFAVLQATVERVDGENKELRGRQSRLESLLRAFSWTADRWARQMDQHGITPDPPHPLVEEYNQTGV